MELDILSQSSGIIANAVAGSARPEVDIGILTIRDDEFRAVLGAFPDKAGIFKSAHREYTLRDADAGGGERYKVAVLRQLEQGNGEAQAAVRDLLDDLAPGLVLVVGIALAIPSDDVKLGDVVLSTRILDFTLEARVAGEETTYATAGGPIHKLLAAAVANLAGREDDLADWTADLPPQPATTRMQSGHLYGPEQWQRSLRKKLEYHYGKGSQPRAPVYVAGPIASSDRLVRDPTLLFPWLATARNIIAVEMESGGVFRAAQERCPMLAIRGISDIVGLQRDAAWTKFACASAAAFTRAFLRTRPVLVGSSRAVAAGMSSGRSLSQALPPTGVARGRGDELLSAVVARYETLQTRQPHDLQRNVLGFFVEPLGSTEPPSPDAVDNSSLVSLSSFVSQAIADRAPCVLLADFGMGKSWFAQMTEYRIARDGLANSAGPVVHPLLFNLRSFRRVVPPSAFWSRLPFFATPEPMSLLSQVRDRAWSTAYGESRTRTDQEHLLHEFEAARQVLLLDGLDEMQRGDAQSLLDEISELSRSQYRSAIMITSRRSFFRDRATEQRLSDLGFRVFYASPWSVGQVEEYLDRAHASGVLAARPVEVLARLTEVPGARDLTSRALLTAMLVAQWAEIGAHDHIDIPSLYKRHVEKALLRWQSARTQQLSIDQLQWYMEEFAMLMFQLDRRSISMREMTTYLSKKFSDIGLERFSMLGDSITLEIQANSLLLRHDDEYFFCHPSFCDFLVARLLLRSLEQSDLAPFSVLHRSKQYRGIIEPFLIPMLPSRDILERLFAEGAVD